MRLMLPFLFCLACAVPAFGETITVLGTRTASPAQISLNADQIDASGATSLGDLLGSLPSFGGQGVNDAQDDNGFGENFVDLRNLNFNRTLVLVDGQRFVLSGIQTDEAVDLNTVPTPFVQRIEVHQDGTQPQFGADAVAGAVDLRLKRDVQGIQMSVYGGAAGAGDGGTADASIVAGNGDANGHLTLGLDLLKRDPILQSDRGWARNPITGTQDGQNLIGSEATPGGHAIGPGIDDALLPGGAARPFNALTDDYNFSGSRYLEGSLRRASVMVAADHTLGSGITADVSLLYTDRSATTLLPPEMLGLNGTRLHPDGFVIPAANAYNPFGVPVTLERVVSEAGPQQTTTSGPVWRVTAGLHGGSDPWSWRIDLNHGQSLSRYATTNAIDLTHALATVGQGACIASTGCVAANWFGPGSLSPAALAYIAYTARSQSAYAETVAQGSVSRRFPLLQAGPARLTLGGELRREDGSTTVDPVTLTGNQAGDDAAPTAGGYNTQEAYLALDIPLLRNLPGAQLLEAQAAARYTRTSRYGSFPTLRAELDYTPLAGLTLQAVSGTSRRPPAIAEAFGGITDLDLPVTDPCDSVNGLRANPVVNRNCLAAGLGPGFRQSSPVLDVASGGNPSLHPERSENEMLAATWQPPSAPGLRFSLAWWHYRITDAIDSLADTDPGLIPNACYESPNLSSPLCALVTRIPGGGNAGQINQILGLDENIGTIKTQGIDAGLSLAHTIQPLGRLSLDTQATWLLDYRLRTLASPAFTQYAGTFPGLNAVGSYARLRTRTTLGLTNGPWSIAWTSRYIGGAAVLDTTQRPAPRLYDDIDLTRRIGQITILAGITNLTNLRPPTLLDGETNTDTSTYDVTGRFLWMRLSCAI